MDTALPQKFPFILYMNLAKVNCTGNRVCTSCDIVVLGVSIIKEVGKGLESRGREFSLDFIILVLIFKFLMFSLFEKYSPSKKV